MIMGLEKKLHHSNVGRRTRKNVLEGKIVSKYNNRYNSKEQILQNCKVVLLRNRKIDIMARSIKIHSSNWLNENSHSGSITCFKKIKEKCFSDSEKIFLQKSSEILSNAFANKVGGLPLSTDNANSKNTLSYKINNGIKFKTNKDSFMNEVTVLSSNKKSNLKETQGKEIDAPHNMRNSSRRKSQILFNASSLVNNKEKVSKRNSEVMSSQDVVLDHREKIFLKNNRTLNSSERENTIKLNMQNSSTENSFVATKRNMKAMDTLNDKSSKFIDIEKSNDKGNGRSSRGKRSILPAAELKCGNESNSSISKGEISPVEEKTSKIKLSFKETREKIHPIYHTRNASVRQYPQVLSDSSSMEEVEVLPSEEKANKISSSFKETRGEKISSVYHRRNSSKRQSPQVLSDTSNVSNYRKSVSKRNAGVASNQDEMPNQREKIYLRNNTTAKRSERDSSKKQSNKKQSVAKSFFETNRKKDPSNALRCSPHNFAFIKCSTNKGNKQNSHRRSTQPMVLSSEEGITLSRSNSASEISSSDEEETENSSSIEKAPRISENNMMQVNDSPNSCAKTAKPMHSESHKTTKKDDRHKKEVASCPIRRSTRTRFPPLASWRNERLKFMKVGSEDIACIDKGLPEDDYAYKYLTKKLYGKKNQKPKASYKNGARHIKKTTISLVTTGEKVQLQLHHPFDTCEWVKPHIESGNVSLCRLFSSCLVNFGFIEIPAHSAKEEQYSLLDNIHFLVVQGTIDAVIASTCFTFRKCDSFIVPVGVVYSLSNKGSSKALLNYCAFKFPFFNYQNI